jgi:hypothetical protein
MTSDAVAEGQITRQKQTALYKAFKTACQKVEDICQKEDVGFD